MTREEEIKDKLSRYDVHYVNPLRDDCYIWCNDDVLYLLASNEELQRRVDSALSIVNRQVERNTCHSKVGVLHINCHDLWALMSVLDGLDAKEQDDD